MTAFAKTASRLRAQPPWLWLAFLTAIVIAFAPYQFLRMPPPEYAITESSRTSPFDESVAYSQRVTLPDEWLRSGAEGLEYGYALPAPNSGGEQIAIYVPFVSQNAALWIDGLWFGDGGSMQAPVARNWNRPLLFVVDARIVSQANDIRLQVRSSGQGEGYLGTIYVGPRDIIEPYFDRHLAWRVEVERSLTTALVVFGSLTLMIGLLRRNETPYLWFSATAFLWALHELNLFLVDIPLPDRLWETFVIVTLGWSFLSMQLFVYRYINVPLGWLTPAFIAWAFVGPLPMFLMDLTGIRTYGYVVWLALLVPIGLYTLGKLFVHYARTQDRSASILSASGLVLMVFAAHDLMMASLVWNREDAHLMQFGALLSIAVIGLLLIARFIEALDTAERLTGQLEARIQAKEAELKRHYERVARLEHESAINEERERIMRDIHDGVGGQLVTALTLLDSSQDKVFARESIADALIDLRLVIDSLDVEASDLATALGMLRMRLESKLKAAGVTLKWVIDDLPELAGFGPGRALQVMRIVQEALTNAMRHANAQSIRLEARADTRDGIKGASIAIVDDGTGFDPTSNRGGRGLANQRYRADAIDAVLDLTSSPAGTRVSLWLPQQPITEGSPELGM